MTDTQTLTATQISKIKNRIRTMLNGNGRTEAEAATYTAKAETLMAKHGWTMADVALKGKVAPEPKPEPQPQPTAKPAKKAAKAKAKPQAGAKRRGPEPEFKDHQVITMVVANPKRPGSMAHGRFAKYRKGMTIRQALDAGLRREDFSWDIDHGFINIE